MAKQHQIAAENPGLFDNCVRRIPMPHPELKRHAVLNGNASGIAF
ncbi:MAG: hypothetical protein JWO42_3801, partial [Chloroflexi bacterium]|nr:hypothetical protein [Chloroflexota bacterium]